LDSTLKAYPFTWEEIMLYSGIDLHKKDLVIDTLDASGTVVAHQRIRALRPLVAHYFRSLPGPHRATVESTASWYWLADLLKEEKVDLTLAHAKLVKAIAYAKVKTDAVDSHTLAQLLRVDLIPRAYMISPDLRGVRDVLRVRLRTVQKRSRCLNAITSLITKYNVRAVEDLPALARLEAECHQQQIALDLAGWRLNRVVYVADGGMMSEENLSHLARGGSGYIVGVPLRKSKEAQAVLSRPGRFRAVAENLEVKEIAHPSAAEVPVAERRRRYVLCRNPEEARRQKHRRAELLRELEAELEVLEARKDAHPKAACRLQTSRRFGPYLKQRKDGRLQIDRARIAQEEKLDGKWLVVTNDLSLSAEDVALGYKQLVRVEESFRRLKHGIDIRPVHHRTPERIEAHVFTCMLALLLERVAERRTGERWGEIRRQFGRIKMVAYAGNGGRVLQTTEPTAEQRKLLKSLKIETPKLVHQVG
jgi:hypothetical protein